MAKIAIDMKGGELANIAPSINQDIVIGIDLGTTNSLVAYVNAQNNQAQIIAPTAATAATNETQQLVPSIIYFNPGSTEILVGIEAKPHLISNPENTIYSVKRLMGKSYADVQDLTNTLGYEIINDDTDRLVKIRVGNRFFTPIELSGLILQQLKQRAEEMLNLPVTKAVITVPAYFNDAQRQATRDAGKLAGLDVLRIINEPTAASLAYGLGIDPAQTRTIAVYDLGGGTFDISVLRIENGIFEVLATNGDTFLGGDDINRAIVNWWLPASGLSSADLSNNKSLGQAWRLAAEQAKIALSAQPQWQGTVNGIALQLTQTQLAEIAQPLISQTINCCKNALADAKLTANDLNEIVLVGGSTRMPLIKQAVANYFNRPIHDALNPDEVVALGAAVQASILAGGRNDLLLLDITPLSLGIETMGGLMDVLIPRNSRIPIKAARQYTTQLDGQANMRITIYQGERDLVSDNRKLGAFDLKGIPAMPAGMAKVEVSFTIDADGITRVAAKELRSGVSQSIEVRPQYGVTEEELATMLLDSIKNAKSDMQTRALREAQVEAEQLIATAERFMAKNTSLLTEEEINGTKTHIKNLQTVLSTAPKDELHTLIEALNQFTRPFAERLMSKALTDAMHGKKITN